MVMHSHLPRHFHSLIGIGLVLIWLLYVLYLVVGLSFNQFLIPAIHSLQQTTRNIINAKI